MRGEGDRLLRELAARDALAARVRDREPGGWRGLRAGRLGPHGLRRPVGRDARRRRAQAAVLHATRRAALARRRARRRHDRPDGGGGLAAVRAGDRHAGAARDDGARWGDALLGAYGFLRRVQPDVHVSPCPLHARARRAGDGLVRRRHARHRPGADRRDDRESARSELVWKTMRKNPYIVRGLRRAGFTGGWLDRRRQPLMRAGAALRGLLRPRLCGGGLRARRGRARRAVAASGASAARARS